MLSKKAVVDYLPSYKFDLDSNLPDFMKSRQLLEWQPVVSFQDIMQVGVDWFQSELPYTSESLETGDP